METLDPETNRLYSRAEDVHPSHWERLAARDPREAARAAGAEWCGGVFRLPMLGAVLEVDLGARAIRPAVGYQRALVALAYLGGAVEAPVKGEWVRPRDMPGGDAFFRGPHSVGLPRLVRVFGPRPGALVRAAERLGGRPVAEGDAGAEIPALPRVPVRVLVWGASEEFGASATLLTDARAHLHLALDVLWALTNVVISDLVEAAR